MASGEDWKEQVCKNSMCCRLQIKTHRNANATHSFLPIKSSTALCISHISSLLIPCQKTISKLAIPFFLTLCSPSDHSLLTRFILRVSTDQPKEHSTLAFLLRSLASSATSRRCGAGHRRSTSNAVAVMRMLGVFVSAAKEQARCLAVGCF